MLEYFINNAWALDGSSTPGGSASGLFMFAILFLVFYFFLIRPQMKQDKEHKKLVAELSKGDEIVTSGGLLGRISQVGENFIVLDIAKDLQVKVRKQSVTSVMPKGTMKSL